MFLYNCTIAIVLALSD